jgi:adenine phosphoribosyltransferase
MDNSDHLTFCSFLSKNFPLVNDHPDVAGLLRDPYILQNLGTAMANRFVDKRITKVIAPEARGPVLGALVATYLKAGLVLVRKEGRNHPGADSTITSKETWTGERIGFLTRSFDLDESDRVLIVDDWATTGNTIRVAKKFIDENGATYIGSSVIVNKSDTEVLKELNVAWLVNFDDLV